MDTTLQTEMDQALRSGRYKQAKDVLLDKRGAMCCLGVLATIQGAEKHQLYCQMTDTLPTGMNAGLKKGSRKLLATMNDSGATFKEIATYVAKRPYQRERSTMNKEIEFRKAKENECVHAAESFALEKRYTEAARWYSAAEVHREVRQQLERYARHPLTEV